MSTAIRLGLLVLAPLLFTSLAPGQQNASTAAPASRRIVLDVVVTPKSGKPVPGLQEQDFTLLDNKTPRPIASFRAVNGNEPVSVILLVDTVNTDYQRVAYEREQLDKFLSANGGHLAHPTKLAFFTDTGTQIQQGSTTDGNSIKAALDQYTVGLRSIRRTSGIYGDGERFELSIKTLGQLVSAESRQPGRTIILWISPGWPLLSGPGIYLDHNQQEQIFNDVINLSTQLRQSRITLYGVDPLGAGQPVSTTYYYQGFLKGVSRPDHVDAADLGLQVLATQTGGLALSSNNDIAAMLQTCVDDTEAYYEISFDAPPTEHPNEYHSIDLKLANPGLIARTRTGYYSQP
jgi:VWFA-related protein